MNQQTSTTPSATSQNQGGEAGQQGTTPQAQQEDQQQGNGTPAEEGGQEGGEGGQEPQATHRPDPDKVIGRLTQRLGKTTAEKHQMRQRIAELEAELEHGGRRGRQVDQGGDEGGGQGGSDEARFTEDEVQRRAATIAQERARITGIASKVGAMLEAGKSIPNFNALSAEVGQVLPVVDGRGMPTPFIEAVVECGNAAEVMAHLGSNPDLVDELADLTPRQQERRIVELSAELKHSGGAKKLSRAPRPLEPVNGRSGAAAPAVRSVTDELAAIRASR